jgi:multidrug efflux pump subunit AcrA (membrane-fusion protein)
MGATGTIVWCGRGVLAATEVETPTPRVERSGGAPSGTPLLTASGYVVARRKAVVSANIQGRLADLRVEEGAPMRKGAIIARLESRDYDAQVRRAPAQVQQVGEPQNLVSYHLGKLRDARLVSARRSSAAHGVSARRTHRSNVRPLTKEQP